MSQETLLFIVLGVFIFIGLTVFNKVSSQIRLNELAKQDPWNKVYADQEGQEDYDEIFLTTQKHKNEDEENPFDRENLKKFLRIKNVRIHGKH